MALSLTHQNWLVMMKPSGIQFSEPQRWLEPWSSFHRAKQLLLDLGSSDGVLVCYQKIYSLVRLARKKKIKRPKQQASNKLDNG